MAQTVFHMLDQLFGDSVVLQTVMKLCDDGLYNKDVGSLIVAADVIDFAGLSAVCNHIDGLAVILYIQPVTDLHTVTVYRKLFVMLHVVDHQRDQLLRELIGAVVVAAAGDVHGHAVGVMERLHKQIS